MTEGSLTPAEYWIVAQKLLFLRWIEGTNCKKLHQTGQPVSCGLHQVYPGTSRAKQPSQPADKGIPIFKYTGKAEPRKHTFGKGAQKNLNR